MVGLEGTRVVVVDDQMEDAAPVIQALSSHGIPSVWYTGEVRDLPAAGQPLANVRLLLLDVDLQGTGGTDKVLANALVAVVRRLVPTDAAGLVIVLWTGHPDVKVAFIDTLLATGGPTPVVVEAFPKDQFRTGAGFDVGALAAALDAALQAVQPWPVLMQWERESREATGDVVSLLAKLAQGSVAPPAGDADLLHWQQQQAAVMAALIQRLAEADLGENNVTDGPATLRGFFSAVAPLLHDQLESRTQSLSAAEPSPGDDIRAKAEGVGLPAGTKARVNAKLGLAEHAGVQPWTGNLYQLAVGPPREDDDLLTKAFDQVYPREQFVNSLVDILAAIGKEMKADKVAERKQLVRDAVIGIILADVHPACDHAQRKTECGRFVTGVRVRAQAFIDKAAKSIKSLPDYIWIWGPAYDAALQEDYWILLDLRRPFTCGNEAPLGCQPWCRLRQQVASDLQARTVGHGGRQGMLLMTGPDN